MHEVLVNRLEGLSLSRKSVVRLTDRPDMTLDVYRGRKATTQQQQLFAVADMVTSVMAKDDSILPNSHKTMSGCWKESDWEGPLRCIYMCFLYVHNVSYTLMYHLLDFSLCLGKGLSIVVITCVQSLCLNAIKYV